MTTTAFHGRRLHRAAVRPVQSPRRRLRVRGGHPHLRWWHRRVVLGFTLAGAMTGALAGVVLGYLREGMVPFALLQSYGLGALLGAGVGLLLGLVMSLLLGLIDRYVRPQSVQPRPEWVLYKED